MRPVLGSRLQTVFDNVACVTCGSVAPGVFCGSGFSGSPASAGIENAHSSASARMKQRIGFTPCRTGRACRGTKPRHSRDKRRTGPSERRDFAQFVHHGLIANGGNSREAKLGEEGEIGAVLPVVGPGHAV